MAHTPAPWCNGGSLGAASGWIIGPNKEQIAVVYGPGTNADAADNCRLIVAAPNLLAFHDAWVESEVANATGNPDLAREKRKALIERHKAVNAKFGDVDGHDEGRA